MRRLATVMVFILGILVVAAAKPQVVVIGSDGPAAKRLSRLQRAVVIDIDGLGRDTLYGLLAEEPETIPNIHSLIGDVAWDSASDCYRFYGAAGVNRATTVLPSVTLPSQLAILTGRWPANHGIPANAWFSRLLAAEIDAEDLLEAILGDVFRKDSSETLLHLIAREGVSAAYFFDPVAMVRHDKIAIDPVAFDTAMTTAVLSLVNRIGLPMLLIIYYPGNDIQSHNHGVQTQRAYLQEILDPLIGRLLHGDGKADGEGLKGFLQLQPDLLETTLFVFCADHGHVNVTQDGGHAIGTAMLNGHLAAAGYEAGQNAVYVPNGGAGLLYLKNRALGNWARPRAREDVLAAAHALTAMAQQNPSPVDFFLVRVGGQGDGRAYRVMDPSTGRLYPPSLFFLMRKRSGQDYPYAVRRIHGADPNKLGDIVIFPNRTDGFTCAEGSGVASDHGSLGAAESYVPMIFAGGGVVPGTITRGRNIDIAPTVAQALQLRWAWRNADGRTLPINGWLW